ncbi:hypothetical protein Cni_G03155 [Canna indica]|uniref:Uncharacterized protein ycf33 n=1 Tax=Canna indica TaxID=4628 RepID=A0AAQ3JRZ5_9LILI|nr:hypothetical protein Cni_G03155 [Canna indica]
MNCVLHLKPHLHLPRDAQPIHSPSPPPPPPPYLQTPTTPLLKPTPTISRPKSLLLPVSMERKDKVVVVVEEKLPRWILLGGASLGLALLVMGMDPQHRALALGPEGPLMEEFWDNVRRYVLYALTVSTGAIYTISQPIIELLKNPITAVLIIIFMVGTFYLLSQVLTAMVGINEFSYDYAY